MYKLTIKIPYLDSMDFVFETYDLLCVFLKMAMESDANKNREYVVEKIYKEGEE